MSGEYQPPVPAARMPWDTLVFNASGVLYELRNGSRRMEACAEALEQSREVRDVLRAKGLDPDAYATFVRGLIGDLQKVRVRFEMQIFGTAASRSPSEDANG